MLEKLWTCFREVLKRFGNIAEMMKEVLRGLEIILRGFREVLSLEGQHVQSTKKSMWSHPMYTKINNTHSAKSET